MRCEVFSRQLTAVTGHPRQILLTYYSFKPLYRYRWVFEMSRSVAIRAKRNKVVYFCTPLSLRNRVQVMYVQDRWRNGFEFTCNIPGLYEPYMKGNIFVN
jgi:hypothetical protein